MSQESYVQVAPDSTGKKIRNIQNTVSGNDVQQQVVTQALEDGSIVNRLNPEPTSVADGANIALGSTRDAEAIWESAGTVSGRLHGLVKILSDVWAPLQHWLQVKVINALTVTSDLQTPTYVAGTLNVAGDEILIPCDRAATVLMQVISTDIAGGIIWIRGSVDGGVTYGSLSFSLISLGTLFTQGFITSPNSYNAGSIFLIPCAGLTHVKATALIDLGGTVGANLRLTASPGTQPALPPFTPSSVNIFASGTSLNAAPGGASAGVFDSSLVVALSPNSPVPSGTNVIGHVIVDSSVEVHNEDTAFVDGDKGVLALAVRSDTPRVLQNADLDYATLITDALGNLSTNEQGYNSARMRSLADAAVMYAPLVPAQLLGMTAQQGRIGFVSQPRLGMS